MAFEILTDQIKEQLQATAGRISESPAWNQLVEQFQDRSPAAQRAILASLGFALALIIFWIPWMFFSDSMDTLSRFEDKKKIARDAYHFGRTASAIPATNDTMSTMDLRNAVNGVLTSAEPMLLPEQTVSINEFDNSKAQSTALPKGLAQPGLMVSLTKLNLAQATNIGARFQSLRKTVTLVGVSIKAMTQPPGDHYFDATYKIVAFNLPPEPAAKPGQKPGAKPGGAPAGK